MKKLLVAGIIFLASVLFIFGQAPAVDNNIGKSVEEYFSQIFRRLEMVAQESPSVEDFRLKMKPAAGQIEGFFGASLIDPDFVIRQVYHPSHFLARGYDLKKVKELKDFYQMMKEYPASQLSEPGHGSLVQPRLIAMRYPVMKAGKLINIVSMMVRTEAFLKVCGLDKCKAFKIICRGKLAETKGNLSGNFKEVTLKLPSTEWLIQYEE